MDVEERIREIEEEIRRTDKNKATEKHLKMLKTLLARLRKRARSGGPRREGFRRSGDVLVAFVGSNSWLARVLPSRKVVEWEGVKFDLVPVSLPPEDPSPIREADAVLPEDEDVLGFLASLGVYPGRGPPPIRIRRTPGGGLKINGPQWVADYLRRRGIKNAEVVVMGPVEEKDLEVALRKEPRFPLLLREFSPPEIFTGLGLVRVRTRRMGEKASKPLVLRPPATIRKVAERIHKDLLRRFRFATVVRKGRRIRAGLDYVLEDGDEVEIRTGG